MWAKLGTTATAAIVLFSAIGAGQQSTMPYTPAGRALSGWLDAFNRDQGDAIAAFDRSHVPWLDDQGAKQLRIATGGYELLAIGRSSRLWIVFRVRQKIDAKEFLGTLVVNSADPSIVSELKFQPVNAAAGVTLSKADRTVVVETLSRVVRENYVFPAVGERIATGIGIRATRGDYDGIADGDILAARLTDDLRAVGDDRHLLVRYTTGIVPPDPPSGRPPPIPWQPVGGNCGFDRVTHLSPSIGYLKIDMFAEPEQCIRAAVIALRAVADSKALIIDLRQNHGGSPWMVALLAGYLFRQETHLDNIYDRQSNSVKELWTEARPPVELFTRPVYVLTSRHTFSAAEEFCYDLKALRRVTLIGERTGGGAHSVSPHRLGDHFFAGIPFGRFINPITKTDWEGKGVQPDVAVDANKALDEALRRATSGARSRTSRPLPVRFEH
jgi:hypothetical protein